MDLTRRRAAWRCLALQEALVFAKITLTAPVLAGPIRSSLQRIPTLGKLADQGGYSQSAMRVRQSADWRSVPR